jgi:nickel-type superoxide dismutase maturation protease
LNRTYHRARHSRKVVLAALLLGIAAAYAFRRLRPFRVEVEGTSMRPTLEPGEWAIAVALGRVRRGDVLVIEHPERPGFEIVKRVTAVEGDRTPAGDAMGEEEIWVEGDSPDGSTDSRHFGPVRMEHVRGRVRLVWWPLGRMRLV